MQARAVFILRSGRSAYDPEVTLRCFRLVLNPFHVRREFPRPRKTEVAPVSGEPAPDEVRNPGGRPKATWREPVLIEIAGQLLDGDLKPKKLADVEKAAKEWLGKQGEYPGDRTVREVVRPLYLRFLQEGKKP